MITAQRTLTMFSSSHGREEHAKHVREVITRLGNAGLQIDINKSEFYTKKTKYLGLIISTDGMSMDPEKVQVIQAWKIRPRLRNFSSSWALQISTADSFKATPP